jgi:hypothetical protein
MDTKPKTTITTEQKPYSKPQLIEHGKINDLTQSGYMVGVEDGLYTSNPI